MLSRISSRTRISNASVLMWLYPLPYPIVREIASSLMSGLGFRLLRHHVSYLWENILDLCFRHFEMDCVLEFLYESVPMCDSGVDSLDKPKGCNL